MRNNLAFAVLAVLCLSGPAAAQGYAGLGQSVEGYATVRPDTPLRFPKDHGAHPDYRIEWWYLTANLRDAAGRDMGLQWTLFRQARAASGPDEGWESRQIWMGHAALTTADTHRSAEIFARGGIGQAGVTRSPLTAGIDDWALVSADETLDQIRVTASGDDFSYDVTLVAEGPLVLQGDRGYSVKSDNGQASYYYSQPHYTLTGTVTRDGEAEAVTGTGWLDREWSSQPLSGDQSGWDWFALTLDDGSRVMMFRLRGTDTFSTGSWTAPGQGPVTPAPGGVTQTPHATHKTPGREIPVRWPLARPEKGLDVEVAALNPDAYMPMVFPYWEGPIRVEGSHSGVGYLEMTGY